MVAILDRNAPLTVKGDNPSLQFQVLWSSLRRELAALGSTASGGVPGGLSGSFEIDDNTGVFLLDDG